MKSRVLKKPNLFIVGAPKSGTTALYQYLSEHPNVFMSPLKEPHYFATDLERGISKENKYFSLFQKANGSHLYRGEASVWYMYSRSAISNIRRFDPDSKIIIMLRNPVDMVYSKHAQLVYNFEEDEADFETAWRLQEKRRRGEALPKYVVNPEFLYYEDVGRLGDQTERIISVFPRDQVKVILFEEFNAVTASSYRDTLAFLGLRDDGRIQFPRINKNCVHRSPYIGRMIKKPPRGLKKSVKGMEDFLGVEQFWGIDLITRLNTKTRERPELDPFFRKELKETFREDIIRLSGMIGRDLSHWLDK